MFSAFWGKAYNCLFEGSTLIIHPQTDLDQLSVIGRVLSHGYLVTGILPIRIAVPTLCGILLGPSTRVPDNILLDTFLDYISNVEISTFKQALSHSKEKQFPFEIRDEFMNTLSRFGGRILPTPSTLIKVIQEAAHY